MKTTLKLIVVLLMIGNSVFSQNQNEFTSEQNYLFETMKTRRSVRNFKDTPVPQSHIEKIIEMAITAPTAGNQQPWKFLVLQDRQKLDQLRENCLTFVSEILDKRGITGEAKSERMEKSKIRYTNYLSAPVYVVVLVDSASKYPSYNTYDGANAATLLMVAAKALGYGTVYSQDTIPYELIKEVFNIPDQFAPICFTPIGVPADGWPSKTKKPLEEFIVNEKFEAGVNYTPLEKKKKQNMMGNM